MRRRPIFVFSVIMAFSLLFPLHSKASWPSSGVAVSAIAYGDQYAAKSVAGAEGKAIISWLSTDGNTTSLFVQCIDAAGQARWGAGGIAVGDSVTMSPDSPASVSYDIASDGLGGVIIAWTAVIDGTIALHAQRIGPNGTANWNSDGISIATSYFGGFGEDSYRTATPCVLANGAGGAIISWSNWEYRIYEDPNSPALLLPNAIHAQHIDAGGQVRWGSDGVQLCDNGYYGPDLSITADGSLGAIVSWQDIYGVAKVQRIDVNGIVHWTTGGVSVSEYDYYKSIVADGYGGVFISWVNADDIYAQYVNAQGQKQWIVGGMPICTAPGIQRSPTMAIDHEGSLYLAWVDRRNGDADIYAEKLSYSGDLQWMENGIAVCSAGNDQFDPVIDCDATRALIIVWGDYRNEDWDIYAQRIDAEGANKWIGDGMLVCSMVGAQEHPQLLCDETFGALICWDDKRSGDYDVYGSQVALSGAIGYLAPNILSIHDVPGDQGGRVNIAWDGSAYDYFEAEIMSYDILRKVVGGDYERIDSMPAYCLEGYSKVVATTCDSTAASNGYQSFVVVARTSDPARYYVSEPDSGYSVDNLAPSPPQGLSGEQSFEPGGLVLEWHSNSEPDVSRYAVYRGFGADFAPCPSSLVASVDGTTWFDGEWRWNSGYYYKVSAIDDHGNESPWVMLGPDGVTGEETLRVPLIAYLAQNYPNPFNPITNIEYGISADAVVSLRIYDAAGRLVRALVAGHQAAGEHVESWDGKDSNGAEVASGIYFCRLDTGTFTQMRKMVVIR